MTALKMGPFEKLEEDSSMKKQPRSRFLHMLKKETKQERLILLNSENGCNLFWSPLENCLEHLRDSRPVVQQEFVFSKVIY